MDKIDYKKTSEYWNQNLEQKGLGKFSSGYIIPVELESVALYRFNKELDFLNKFGKFGGNYLDLGCGAGNLLYEWHDNFDHLVGIDFSDSLIQIANKQNENYNNVKIYKDSVLNFEKYVSDKKFKFIFVGGCFMYLGDEDILDLITNMFQKLENGGVLIFREPTATKKRIYEKNIGIRRTIDEYKNLICLDKNGYILNYYQNYPVNYTHFIGLYLKIFPFLTNKIKFFNNILVEFIFLYLPLTLYSKIKNNMALYHFFILTKSKL